MVFPWLLHSVVFQAAVWVSTLLRLFSYLLLWWFCPVRASCFSDMRSDVIPPLRCLTRARECVWIKKHFNPKPKISQSYEGHRVTSFSPKALNEVMLQLGKHFVFSRCQKRHQCVLLAVPYLTAQIWLQCKSAGRQFGDVHPVIWGSGPPALVVTHLARRARCLWL